MYDTQPFEAKGKPYYGNWMPEEIANATMALTGGLVIGNIVSRCLTDKNTRVGKMLRAGLNVGVALGAASAIYAWNARRKFSYEGKRKLSKEVVEGIADFVRLPDGGIGLDVGCGSGALTIACAKKNPRAQMIGIDTWNGGYREFSRSLCMRNAEAEGVTNVKFRHGNAIKLDFEDEVFDVVTSNYVYHNIPSTDRKKLIKETLRTLKKGGEFVIHDIMTRTRYGDIDKFVQELRDEGYADVRLIDTTDGMFMKPKEAKILGLKGSKILIGTK